VIRHALPVLAVLALLAGCTASPDAAAPPTPTLSKPPSAITCESAEPEVIDMEGATWVHPRNSFYEGTEEDIPGEYDLQHLLLGDNAIVVIYDRAALPQAAIDPLRDWITYETAAVAIPSTDEPRAPIEVRIADTVTLCDGVDTLQLTELSQSRTFGDVEQHGDEGTSER